MTPDELARIEKWVERHWGWLLWIGFCLVMAVVSYILYKNPSAVTRSKHNGHGKPSALIMAYCFLVAVPGLPLLYGAAIVAQRLNNRIARFRLRRQDSLARLTKRHEKMLRDIRKLEREVSERTEDLPPETLAVSMRDYSDRTSDY